MGASAQGVRALVPTAAGLTRLADMISVEGSAHVMALRAITSSVSRLSLPWRPGEDEPPQVQSAAAGSPVPSRSNSDVSPMASSGSTMPSRANRDVS